MKALGHYYYSIMLFCLSVSILSHAYGDNALMLGLSSRASAMGGAMTAASDDYTATFYNPALLPWAVEDNKWLQTGITYIYTSRNFEVVDSSGERAESDFKTNGIAMGFTMDIDRLVGLKDCSLGLNLFVPTDAPLTVDIASTPNDYSFPIYDDLGKHLNAYTGVAYRIWKRISLGVGTNILARLPNTDSHIKVYVDVEELLDNPELIEFLIQEGSLALGNSVDVKPTVNRELVLTAALHAGVAVDALDWLRIGLSFRDKLGATSEGNQYIYILPVDNEGNVVNDLASRFPVIQVPVSFYMIFNPRQYSLGIAIEIAGLMVDLDITYAIWSDYRGPHKEKPPESFKDTWNPSIGAELNLGYGINLRGGYAWRPSPIPSQKGQTNYLDSDTSIICFGGAYQIGNCSLEAHLQYHIWKDRNIEKEGDLPSIKYKGSLLNTGLSFIVEF